MNRFVTEFFIKRFLRATSGATAIEYAIIAGGISIVIIGGVTLVGGSLTDTFSSIATGV